MPTIIDARGLSCPQPVILARKALRDSEQITTIVDNEAALENITRMAEKEGCRVQTEKRDDGMYLHIARGNASLPDSVLMGACTPASGPLVLMVSSEFLGRGDEELGHILIRTFFHTLGEVQPSPDSIIFVNSGVKLTVEGAPTLEDLQALAGKGKQILICGTCLGHYDLKDKVAVGEVSNMYAIAEMLMRAGKVINL